MPASGTWLWVSLARLGRTRTDGAFDEKVRVPLNVESERPPEVDVREVRGPDPPKPVLLDSGAITLEPRHVAVHATRVPGHHDVGRLPRARVPLRRFLQPVEIAHLAVYLGAAESDGMTGQSILLDGGMLMV